MHMTLGRLCRKYSFACQSRSLIYKQISSKGERVEQNLIGTQHGLFQTITNCGRCLRERRRAGDRYLGGATLFRLNTLSTTKYDLPFIIHKQAKQTAG